MTFVRRLQAVKYLEVEQLAEEAADRDSLVLSARDLVRKWASDLGGEVDFDIVPVYVSADIYVQLLGRPPALRLIPLRKYGNVKQSVLSIGPCHKLALRHLDKWQQELDPPELAGIAASLRRGSEAPALPLGHVDCSFPADVHFKFQKAAIHIKDMRSMPCP
jgi:hypothetical protein